MIKKPEQMAMMALKQLGKRLGVAVPDAAHYLIILLCGHYIAASPYTREYCESGRRLQNCGGTEGDLEGVG